ncbi:PLC-like phosphodiesterase [Aspergillus avenaceus]|uniref:Altered inheritance of mitochondria protein 6 n=1 Tax=Aspergillus avenaceus TaxID=36643 RepID=A0A5N6TJ37_ASPAV|nr:PLC-like phosphodiesterase [Aspergillus avenaceus]
MSSPFRSPPVSNSAHIASLHANDASFDPYRDSEDGGFKLDRAEYTLAINANEGFDRHAPNNTTRSAPSWSRELTAISPFSSSNKEADIGLPLLGTSDRSSRASHRRFRKLKLSRCLLYPLLGFFVMLGVVQFVTIACGIIISFFPDEVDRLSIHWRQEETSSAELAHWPTDFSRDIVPVACHSHNDYWRPIPLFSAIKAGCVGVEADVWLFDKELYVGHTTSSLTPQRTLRKMYIDPLVKILDKQNPITAFHPTVDEPLQGVFDTDPSRSLILLIDSKTDGDATWDSVVAQLAPLRDRGYLTHFNGTDVVNGPVTVVGTGNTPFNQVTANTTYREIFFDAPLELLADEDNIDDILNPNPDTRIADDTQVVADSSTENVGQGLSGLPSGGIGPDTFNWTNSYYASVSFKDSIGFPWFFHLTDRQVGKIRAQIRGAHRRGLKVRYWNLPNWPRGLRNHVWHVLVREGVDMLNVDDLQSATRQDWSPKLSDWWR